MAQLKNLKAATSLKELAPLLGYKPRGLSYILYQMPNDVKYRSFEISKKNGGTREILAPNDKLKKLQQRLAELLQDCLEELEKGKKSKNHLSHGFHRGLSIVTNAKKHRNKKYVLNLDLSDFFPSIHFGRVRGYFIKNRHFQLHENVATVIAQIACFEGALPQGSPCSPVISNLVAHSLDVYLVQLAKKYRCTYSRYADDLTFSTGLSKFPKEIAYESDQRSIVERLTLKKVRYSWRLSDELTNQIQRAGFTINDLKTRMQYKNSRQVVTGLVVNSKVNVKREYYSTVRSQCNELFQRGDFYIKSGLNGDQDKNPGSLQQLEGALNFIYQVKKPKDPLRPKIIDKNGKPYSKKWLYEKGPIFERKESTKDGRKPERGILKLYCNFLYYKYFHGLTKPLIICEGKTDNVYLSCALNQLAEEFPLLATKEREVTYNLQILDNHGMFREVCNFGEGAPFLGKLIRGYQELLKPFKCAGRNFPVIIIVDNDDGPRSSGVYSSLKKYGHNNVDGNEPYYHVVENLYLVPLPKKKNKKDIDFEGLFDEATLKIPYKGKSFKRDPKDMEKEFGKSVFAEQIVRRKQSEIDFSGFKPILSIVTKIVTDYEPS